MCSPEYIDFVCRQLAPLGEVKARKMMGDFIIYVNGKCVLTACDELCFIQQHPSIAEMMKSAEVGVPYPGAKPRYVLDIDHASDACRVIATLWEHLPYSKESYREKHNKTHKRMSI